MNLLVENTPETLHTGTLGTAILSGILAKNRGRRVEALAQDSKGVKANGVKADGVESNGVESHDVQTKDVEIIGVETNGADHHGAGKNGKALSTELEGVLGNGTAEDAAQGTSAPDADEIPTRFLACVRTVESAAKLTKEYAEHSNVAVLHNDNLRAVEAADCIVLGCQPQDLEACIGAPALVRALRGKLLVSILAGVTIPQIEAVLGRTPRDGPAAAPPPAIVRAMPNTAAAVRASTTVVTTTALAPAQRRVTDWLLGAIGSATYIPAARFDACTALCGSGPAFVALFLEALADGAVNLGLKRADAVAMAANTLRGTADLVLAGEHPAVVRDKVATPGGSTIKGLHSLEEGRLRAVVAGALMNCAKAAHALGGE